MLKAKHKFIFIIDGETGAGKTTVGKLIGSQIKRTVVFDMDQIKGQISDFKRGISDNEIVRDIVLRMAEGYCVHNLNIIIPQGILPKYLSQYSFQK